MKVHLKIFLSVSTAVYLLSSPLLALNGDDKDKPAATMRAVPLPTPAPTSEDEAAEAIRRPETDADVEAAKAAAIKDAADTVAIIAIAEAQVELVAEARKRAEARYDAANAKSTAILKAGLELGYAYPRASVELEAALKNEVKAKANIGRVPEVMIPAAIELWEIAITHVTRARAARDAAKQALQQNERELFAAWAEEQQASQKVRNTIISIRL
jgi:hypothetical protein